MKNKSVLVLGVGPEEGLGAALCKIFANDGYDVFGCGRNKENMNKLTKIKTKGGSINCIVADVTKTKDVEKIFQVIDGSKKELSSVIYNAEIIMQNPF